MQSIEPILTFLSKFGSVHNQETINTISSLAVVRTFEKKQIVTAEGDVEQYFNFITKGLLVKYYFSKGEKRITQVSHEGHLINCQESFISQKPSEETIEALEHTTVISLPYTKLEEAFAASHEFEHLGRLLILNIFLLKSKWEMMLNKLSPRELFLYFVEHNPIMLQRVPQKTLASFLRIKPETFSRFKHIIKLNNSGDTP